MSEALQQEQIQAAMVLVVSLDSPWERSPYMLLGPLLAPSAGQGVGQAVLASQDPRGLCTGQGSKVSRGKKSKQWIHSSGV